MPLSKEQAQKLRAITEIDWTSWKPVHVATLLFVFQKDHLLLIRKKRGLGKGKINAPGGKVDPGESPMEAAIREVQEELAVTPLKPTYVGEHRFQFTDGYSMHVHVFRSSDHLGEAQESEEAIPIWVPIDAIPYDEMWADDRFWIPLMLEGKSFSGRYIFSGEEMLDYDIINKPN